MHLSFQRIFYVIATIFAIFTVLILAKSIAIPIAFALLIAFILFPVSRKLEAWGTNKIMGAFLSILSLVLIIAGFITLFSSQIIKLSENLTSFKNKVLEVFANATFYINRHMPFVDNLDSGELVEKVKTMFNESVGTLLSLTFSSTAGFLIGLLTVIVFTFLILIYRNALVLAFVSFYPKENREQARKMFKNMQKVGQQYLFGMMIIVLILGFVNSVGLWIIGIDNPFLFGFLAAILAIIPYAGTVLGAAIPIVYSFISYDSFWMPISITIFFWLVQVIESNFLTPKIVGGNLKINALTSILSIIIGASIWGIAGMILFLPFAAMLKVVCNEYVELKPLALLIGEENFVNEDDDEDDNENEDSPNNKWLEKIKGWFSGSQSSDNKE